MPLQARGPGGPQAGLIGDSEPYPLPGKLKELGRTIGGFSLVFPMLLRTPPHIQIGESADSRKEICANPTPIRRLAQQYLKEIAPRPLDDGATKSRKPIANRSGSPGVYFTGSSPSIVLIRLIVGRMQTLTPPRRGPGPIAAP